MRQHKGCPLQTRTDCGTKNGVIAAAQCYCRSNDDYPFQGEQAHSFGTSHHNQRIENWWSPLKKTCSSWWITFFKDLVEEKQLNLCDEFTKECLWFSFNGVLLDSLDEVQLYWDTHYIRSSRHKTTAGVPDILLIIPEEFGGIFILFLTMVRYLTLSIMTYDLPLLNQLGLPKVHKSFDTLPPFRLIIDTTGTAHQPVAKFLTKLLIPLTINEFSIKDTFDAVSDINNLPRKLFDDGYRFVSFDVKSLFTTVPLKKTVDIILNRICRSKLISTTLTKRTRKKLILDSCTKTVFSMENTINKLMAFLWVPP